MVEPYKPAARIMGDKMEKRLSKDVLYWRRMEVNLSDCDLL